MATSGGNNDLSFDPNEKENTAKDLYKSNVEAKYNEFQNSTAYGDPEEQIQWKERAAAINAQRRLEKKIETMDEFSQWLHDNGWCRNYTNSLWFHCKKMKDDFTFSEVYQMFLKSKEA